MMTRVRCLTVGLLPLVMVLLALGVWTPATAQDKDKPARAPVKWEYKIAQSSLTRPPAGGAGGGFSRHLDAKKLEEDLNKLGEDGWECVGTVSESLGEGSGTRAYVLCKRPKP
jgi:hypothetical protein